MLNLDCQHIHVDDDSARCAVCGWIFECPYNCAEYINYFGNKPYADQTEIEKFLKGESQ